MCQILLVIAFEVAYDTARNEFEVALRRGKADKGTAIHQRRTGDAHMNLLGSVIEEGADVVAQLCAAHDGVVTEHDALPLQDSGVWYELHLCHEVTTVLVAWCEGTWPCGGILHHCTLIGNLFTF